MAIFHSYVSLPEGTRLVFVSQNGEKVGSQMFTRHIDPIFVGFVKTQKHPSKLKIDIPSYNIPL